MTKTSAQLHKALTMELSGLNKALHSLHCKKISVENDASTLQEIVFNVNIILGKMKECDHEKAFVFNMVTEKVLQGISSQHYEVYTVLKSLEKMVEVVDAVEEGFSRLELANQSLPYDWAGPWYNCLDNEGFLELPAIHQQMKKLGYEAITELHSHHLLENVRVTEEDLNSSKFRFQLNSKFHGNILVYIIPAVEIEVRPRCLRTDAPLNLKNVLLTANGTWGSSADNSHRSLWQVSLHMIENEVFAHMDTPGGIRWIVRGVLHLLCEKYIHYPVTHKIVDVLFLWNLCAHVLEEDWVLAKLAARVLEILENLRRALRNHRIRNYFMPQYNMFADFDGLKLDKAAERVQCLMQKLKENPYSLQLFAT